MSVPNPLPLILSRIGKTTQKLIGYVLTSDYFILTALMSYVLFRLSPVASVFEPVVS